MNSVSLCLSKKKPHSFTIVSDEESVFIFIFLPIYVIFIFKVILSFSFYCWFLAIWLWCAFMCFTSCSFFLPMLCCFCHICRIYTLHQVLKIFVHYFFKYFFILSSSFWKCDYTFTFLLILSCRSLKLCSFLSFFLCFSLYSSYCHIFKFNYIFSRVWYAPKTIQWTFCDSYCIFFPAIEVPLSSILEIQSLFIMDMLFFRFYKMFIIDVLKIFICYFHLCYFSSNFFNNSPPSYTLYFHDSCMSINFLFVDG